MPRRYRTQNSMCRLGAAAVLRSACTPAAVDHLVAVAEVERRQAAQCSHSHVGHLVGAAEERQRGCSPLLVRPRLSPPSNRRG